MKQSTRMHFWIPACAGMTLEDQARGPAPAGVLGGEMHEDTASAGFALLYPPYLSTRSYSRRDVQRGEASLPRVWGCPPTLPSFPSRLGVRGLKTRSQFCEGGS
jgi:hypothetical protein